MAKSNHSLRVCLAVSPPRPLLQGVRKVAEPLRTQLVRPRVGREDLAMREDGFQILAARGGVAVELCLERLKVGTPVVFKLGGHKTGIR